MSYTPLAPTAWLATDEEIVIACPADFAKLAPAHQKLAGGTDGVFAPSSTGSWVLTSATNDFVAQGLAAGHVVQILGPTRSFPRQELGLVVSATTNSLTMRRVQMAAGAGRPIGPPEGVTAVQFSVETLGPQIERASWDVMQRLGLVPLWPSQTAGTLCDPRQLAAACVALVLGRQYRDMSRMFAESDDFAAKSKRHLADYEAVFLDLQTSLIVDKLPDNNWPRVTR